MSEQRDGLLSAAIAGVAGCIFGLLMIYGLLSLAIRLIPL